MKFCIHAWQLPLSAHACITKNYRRKKNDYGALLAFVISHTCTAAATHCTSSWQTCLAAVKTQLCCMQMCLAAAATLASMHLSAAVFKQFLPRRLARWLSRAATAVVVMTIVVLSLSRSTALVINYGAPMRLYRHLPQVNVAYHYCHAAYHCISTSLYCIALP